MADSAPPTQPAITDISTPQTRESHSASTSDLAINVCTGLAMLLQLSDR